MLVVKLMLLGKKSYKYKMIFSYLQEVIGLQRQSSIHSLLFACQRVLSRVKHHILLYENRHDKVFQIFNITLEHNLQIVNLV